MFPSKYRYSMLVQLPRVFGISPDSLFSEMSKPPRLTNFPTSTVIEPINWFLDISKAIHKDDKPTSGIGMRPLRLFSAKINSCKLMHSPRPGGMLPRKLFLCNCNTLKKR